MVAKTARMSEKLLSHSRMVVSGTTFAHAFFSRPHLSGFLKTRKSLIVGAARIGCVKRHSVFNTQP